MICHLCVALGLLFLFIGWGVRVVNELRKAQLEKIKKLAEMMPPKSAEGAVELVDGPYYTGVKYDFLDTEACARHNPLHRREYETCLGCLRFDRMNMVCTVGRLGKRI